MYLSTSVLWERSNLKDLGELSSSWYSTDMDPDLFGGKPVADQEGYAVLLHKSQ